MHIEKVIQKLGYSPTEVKVYIAALQLGTGSVSDIAQKSELPRTTVQEIIGVLHRQNIVNAITRRSRKFWIAESPTKFLHILEENKAALQLVMPELQALRKETEVKPKIKILSSKEEIANVFDDILETKHHILTIVSWQDWIDVLGEETVQDFIEQRVNHYLKIKLLTPRTDLATALRKKDDKELRTTRFLAEDAHINTSNFIYGNKVAIISLNKTYPTGVIIEDQDIVETMTIFFNTLWDKSDERK